MQPVYIVEPPSGKDFVQILFFVPGIIGGIYGGAELGDLFPKVHPVILIVAFLALAATAIGLAFVPIARLCYAVLIGGVGTILTLMFAPDILWKLFFETVLIVVWGGIAYGFETLQAA